jgi:hypothetical protein
VSNWGKVVLLNLEMERFWLYFSDNWFQIWIFFGCLMVPVLDILIVMWFRFAMSIVKFGSWVDVLSNCLGWNLLIIFETHSFDVFLCNYTFMYVKYRRKKHRFISHFKNSIPDSRKYAYWRYVA